MPARIIVLIYLLFTYSGGLWAPLGSVLIIWVAWMAWRQCWTEHLGLLVSPAQALLALSAIGLAAGAAWISIPAACQSQGIHMTPIWLRDDRIILALHTLGQTFNEEIVLGWMLLATLRRRLPGLTLPALSLTVALIFAVLHYVFYAARPAAYLNFGLLSATALLSVFAAGALRNNLILGIGNISLAWGVHLGWNLIFIDSAYTWTATGGMLSEPAIFNAVFGYLPIMVWLTILMGVSLLLYDKLGARE